LAYLIACRSAFFEISFSARAETARDRAGA
jgi:hypothetical protein